MTEKPVIEIYTLEWCPYCRKAKSFFKSKGLEYQEYDIENEDKKEEMIKRTGGEKTVPQIFVEGELIGGYDQLIKKQNQGKLKELINDIDDFDVDKVWDLVIVGAGPAGLSAAVYAARKGLETLIVSLSMGGQVIETDSIENYLGKYNTQGSELMQSFWEHAQEYDVTIRLGEKVEKISCDEDLRILEMGSEKQIKARTVIIASGTQKRSIGVSGEKEFKGKGVHYCAICDGFLYAGEDVAVVGGGNSGLEACLDLAKLNSNVSLIEITDQLAGDRVLQEKVKSNDKIDIYTCNNIEKIKGQEKVDSIVIRDNNTGKIREINVSAVFVEIGLTPNSGFVSELVSTNERNEIIINEQNETNIEGIWAAGDVTDIKDKQIVVATAEGAKAALRVNEYLNL